MYMIKTIFITNRKGLKMAIRLNINDENTKVGVFGTWLKFKKRISTYASLGRSFF